MAARSAGVIAGAQPPTAGISLTNLGSRLATIRGAYRTGSCAGGAFGASDSPIGALDAPVARASTIVHLYGPAFISAPEHPGPTVALTLPAMTPLRVPPPHVDSFALVRDMEQVSYEALTAALSEARPQVRAEALATTILNHVPIEDADSLTGILRALTSLTGLRRLLDISIDEIAHRLAESPDLESPGIDSVFADRIRGLLAIRSIRVLGKAADLATEHDKVFVTARILTDLRPIFSDDVEEAIEGTVVQHTVKLEFIHDEGNLSNMYIVLDDDDLERLAGLIRRSQQKSATLQQTVESADISFLK